MTTGHFDEMIRRPVNPELDALLRDTWLVAAKVLRDQVTEAVEGDLWGTYPDIGEDDWAMVLAQLNRMFPPIPARLMSEAYERLADRAVKSGAVGDGPWEDEGSGSPTMTTVDTGGLT